MASLFGHGIVGYTIAKVASKKHLNILVFLAILSSVLPDIDVLSFDFGIRYESPYGHRGFTHSIAFALVWALAMAFGFGKSQKKLFFIVIFCCTMSHGVLDAMTTGGRGVGFFIPFDDTRYFLPYRTIKVSPLSIREFFSDWGWQVVLSELKYIVLPCAVILIFFNIAPKILNPRL